MGMTSNEKVPIIAVKPPNGVRNPSLWIHCSTKKVQAKGMAPRRMQIMTKQSLAN